MRLALLFLVAVLVSACATQPIVPARSPERVHVSTYYASAAFAPYELQAVRDALDAWHISTDGRQTFEPTSWYEADIRIMPLRASEQFQSVAHYDGANWADLRGLWVASERTAFLLCNGILSENGLEMVAAHEIGHALRIYSDAPSMHFRGPGESIMWPLVTQFPASIAQGIPAADVAEWKKSRGQ